MEDWTDALTFDSQAADFDRRAGLPSAVVKDITRALAELTLETPRGSVVLDLGAGTGGLGVGLASCLAPSGTRYLGLDLSLSMLGVFRRRASRLPLVRANADDPWPIATSRVDLLFAGRAAHLLHAEPLVREALRVLTPRGRVVLGGVRRQPQSIRATLRRQLHKLLTAHGITPRRRSESWRRLSRLFTSHGLDASSAGIAQWTVTERPVDTLNAWRTKEGLAGRTLDDTLKRHVIKDLERWAKTHLRDLDAPRQATERYELLILRRPELEEEGG